MLCYYVSERVCHLVCLAGGNHVAGDPVCLCFLLAAIPDRHALRRAQTCRKCHGQYAYAYYLLEMYRQELILTYESTAAKVRMPERSGIFPQLSPCTLVAQLFKSCSCRQYFAVQPS